MKRYPYDLSHYVASCGEIGRLQTLSVIPVVANDSISIDFVGAFRLSPLRRALALDCRIDIATFFIPHRHIYGQDWIDFTKAGTNSTTELDAITDPSALGNVYGFIPGVGGATGHKPYKHLYAGYCQIYNQYWRVPNIDDPGDLMDETTIPTDQAVLDYGQPVARLPVLLSTNPKDITDPAYADVSVDVGGTDAFSLFDVRAAMQSLKSNIQRDWFSERYRDILSQVTGSSTVSTDADQRPTLLMRSSNWMSGYDVDGTDDATLGQYAGKSQTLVTHRMPSKYFNEHGCLWTVCALRFPPIFNGEIHPMNNYSPVSGPYASYENIFGDPDVATARTPQAWSMNAFVAQGKTQTIGYMPHSQWYRTQPSWTHPKFHNIAGYPFIDTINSPTSGVPRWMAYEQPGDYDMFQSTELAHWNVVSKFNVHSKRIIPPASYSIFTGADHNLPT